MNHPDSNTKTALNQQQSQLEQKIEGNKGKYKDKEEIQHFIN